MSAESATATAEHVAAAAGRQGRCRPEPEVSPAGTAHPVAVPAEAASRASSSWQLHAQSSMQKVWLP